MEQQNPQTLLAGTGIANRMVLDPETGKDVLDGGVFLTTDGGSFHLARFRPVARRSACRGTSRSAHRTPAARTCW